ncbi:MAG: K(+)-transporting ATPase subunit F [Chitinophagaceae bacterium]|nr:K(+)-transporting ATPase subunit F [Chitinophagaceae bacterium]
MKKSETNHMTALFLISVAVFVYLCYVLLKPENF